MIEKADNTRDATDIDSKAIEITDDVELPGDLGPMGCDDPDSRIEVNPLGE